MMRLEDFLRSNKFTVRLIGFVSDNPVYRGALVIGSGTILAQLIGLVTLPIITRIYNPTEMGVLAVYSSILSIVAIGASFRYEFAYTLPKKEETAANLFILCIVSLSLTSVAFSLIIMLTGDYLANLLRLNSLGHYYWLLIPGFIGTGLYTILNYWAIRQRDYRRITHTSINQSVSGATSKISLGLLSFGPLGLILGHIISQATGIGTLSKAMWKVEKGNFGKVSATAIKAVAKEYWTFPAFNLPASIINALSIQLPSLFLVTLYGSHTVGLYALAYNLLALPAGLISSAIGQAFLGEVSLMVREKSSGLKQFYLKTIKHLAIIAIPIIGTLALAAPFLITLVFGDVWSDAGLLCIPLALMVIPQFIVSPTSRLTIYGFNHWTLAWDIARVSGVAAGFYLGWILDFSVIITLMIYGIIMLIMYIVGIALNLKAISIFTSRMGHVAE